MPAWTMITGQAIFRRWAIPALLAPVAAGTCLLAAPQAALAAAATAIPVASGPIVSGYHNTKCVDDLGDATSNDTPIVISDCNGSAEQTWTLQSHGTLQANGKCMDIYRDEKVNKAGGALDLHRRRRVIYTCNGGRNQQWDLP